MHRAASVIVLIVCVVFILSGLAAPLCAVTKPAKVKITALTSGTSQTEGEITIKWGKTTCTGYQLEYADNKGFTGSRTWSVKGSGIVTKTLTCLTGGKTYYFRIRAYKMSGSSKLCGTWSAVRSIAAHQHEFSSEVTKEPSCGITGQQTYTCTGCKYSYSIKLAALTHDYRMKVTKQATAKQEGERTYTCSRCKDRYTEKIPKKPEAKKSGKSGNAKAKPKASGSTKSKSKSKPKTSAASKTKPEKLSLKERNKKARQAAVDWAVRIAGDNAFHYGKPEWAHHHGCYFCGTNQRAGSAKRRAGASASACAKTYCCNPFVTAAYHHGAGAREVDCRKASKRINLANDRNRALKNGKAFRRISKPRKVTSLKPGDILLTPTHAMLYVGEGRVAHAAHHDNGKRGAYWNSSITCGKISNKQWKRTTKIYRYLGTGRY